MIVKNEYQYSALTGKIIGCAMETHKILGNGFPEIIYQRALEEEFLLEKLNYQREFQLPVFYKNKIIGYRRVDFLVEEQIPVELKAVTKLEDAHLAQAINYLEAYNLEVGLLINFGSKSLEFRRIINPKFNQ